MEITEPPDFIFEAWGNIGGNIVHGSVNRRRGAIEPQRATLLGQTERKAAGMEIRIGIPPGSKQRELMFWIKRRMPKDHKLYFKEHPTKAGWLIPVISGPFSRCKLENYCRSLKMVDEEAWYVDFEIPEV